MKIGGVAEACRKETIEFSFSYFVNFGIVNVARTSPVD